MTKWTLLGIVTLLIIIAGIVLALVPAEDQGLVSFEDCEAAGYPIMESYPRQCTDSEGVVYVEDVEDLPIGSLVTTTGNTDIIRNVSVTSGEGVSSPLTITGEARGMWYFEASFPVTLIAEDGTILVQAPAQAQGEWMTEQYVPFEVTLSFSASTTGPGTLILQKDNPSALPENDDSLQIPIILN